MKLYDDDTLWGALPEELQFPPDVRRELILTAMRHANAIVTQGTRIDVEQLLELDEAELEKSIEDLTMEASNELSDREDMRKEVDKLKEELWAMKTKSGLRNQLHSLLSECQ